MKNFFAWIALVVVLFAQHSWAGTTAPITQAYPQKPKLVLVIVIDQFRADYLTRFESRFLPATGKGGDVGGFRYLMGSGAYFPFAQYDVLQCMTGPGHAMILSGSYPYQMGIGLNVWFDSTRKKPVYCVQDESQPIVGSNAKPGMSPKNFLGTTVGDELKNAGYPSKVVTVALKDRAAILLGGRRANLAIWFDPGSFRWVSSQYYLPNQQLPTWVDGLNNEIAKKKGQAYVWETSGKTTGLSVSSLPFRHETEVGNREILNYPFGVETTVHASEVALDSEKLGRGNAPDLLAVSVSSHDYLGHHYGPNTLELEEMTVAEDRQISRLLNTVRKKIPGGLKNVSIVLTADHGIPPSPAWAGTVKLNSERIESEKFLEEAEAGLEQKIGKPKSGRWIDFQVDANFYLNHEALEDAKIPLEKAESALKQVLLAHRAIAFAFTQGDYERHQLPPLMMERQILKTYIPGKSGEVVGILRPYYIIDDYLVSHMTGYSYDRSVPIVITGPGVRKGVYSTRADVIDIAPTLSFMLGVVAPSLSEGRVLSEIFGTRPQ